MDEFPTLKQRNPHFPRSKSLHYLPDLSNETAAKTHVSDHQCDQEDGAGEIFGVILSRSRSVSSANPPGETAKAENKQRGLAKVTLLAMKKRSFSVSGGYCRIHDQHDIINGGGGENMNPNVSHKRTLYKKKGKILKACMKLLGL